MNGPDRLQQIAANYPSPHVRRMTPLIALTLEGLCNAGCQLEFRGRYVSINNGAFRARYQHPQSNPRRRGGIVIYKMDGKCKGEPIHLITTIAEAIAFHANPSLGRLT